MATYSRSEWVTRTVRFEVPCGLEGACWAEVMKAVRAAHTELWEAGLTPWEKDASDDQIWLHPEDDKITVTIELQAGSAPTAPRRDER